MHVTSTQLVVNYFKRNNPLLALAHQVLYALYMIMTLPSRRKLTRFKYLLEIEKLENMQKTLTEGYVPRTVHDKMNKIY
jgi:hypothetical protein